MSPECLILIARLCLPSDTESVEFSGGIVRNARIDRVVDFQLSEGDRVMLDPGTSYPLSQSSADTVIDMGGGHQMILVGVQMPTLTPDWIFGA